MKLHVKCSTMLTTMFSAALVSCGGGGNDANPSNTRPLEIDFKTPTRAAMLSGQTTFVTVTQSGSKTCTGSGSISQDPAIPSEFIVSPTQKIPALVHSTTHSWTWNNCDSSPNHLSAVTYINDLESTPLAFSSEARYGAYAIPQIFPNKIKAGDTGSFGYIAMFADASQTISIGYANHAYSVAGDKSPDSLMITFVTNFYDANDEPIETGIQIRRLSMDGTITFISDEIRFPQTGEVIAFKTIRSGI